MFSKFENEKTFCGLKSAGISSLNVLPISFLLDRRRKPPPRARASEAQMTFVYDDVFHENRSLQRFGIGYVAHKQNGSGGYTIYNVILGFDSYHLSHVYVQEMVCVDINCETSPTTDMNNGMFYICSDNTNLFKP